MVLPQWRVGLERAADNPFADRLGNAARRRCVIVDNNHRLSIIKTGALARYVE